MRRQVCVQWRPLANGTDVRSKMRRQLVWRHVASVNGSIEIHGKQQVERLLWQHVWQHVASVKAL